VQVEALIEKANELWDDREATAVAAGEAPLGERPLPLVRLKVDTTGVADMSNPVRFGHEFSGRLANPRDVLAFHRSAARKAAAPGTRGARGKSSAPDDVELDLDDGDAGLTPAEKLGRVRVQNLVREYLEKQELQLIGEVGMGDAIETFVEKDDTHAITT
jgi:double-strand break repair protein MRE11